MLGSHISLLMRRLAVEPSSTAELLLSLFLCGTILLTMYSIVTDWRVLRAGLMLSYWSKLFAPFLSSHVFPLSFSIGCYCETGVLGLIGCPSFSPGLALPTFINNNNILCSCTAPMMRIAIGVRAVSRLMGGGNMGNVASLSACGTDAKGMHFPLSHRRKRRILFTQAQVSSVYSPYRRILSTHAQVSRRILFTQAQVSSVYSPHRRR